MKENQHLIVLIEDEDLLLEI
jgi:hypothetical protein